jgi:hypothetical protein
LESLNQNAGKYYSNKITQKLGNKSFQNERYSNIWKEQMNLKSRINYIRFKIREFLVPFCSELSSFFLVSANAGSVMYRALIVMYRALILPSVSLKCETWSVTLKEKNMMRLF